MAKDQKQKRNPTTADVYRALEDFKKNDKEFKDKIITPLIRDVRDLKQYKHDKQVAENAVSEYVKKHGNIPGNSQQKGSEQWLNRELVKGLVIALSIIASLVALASGGNISIGGN